MVNDCCKNELCVNTETQLRLARLREELLTNFNSILIDRVRFLEQTINRLSLMTPSTTIQSPAPFTDKLLPPEIVVSDRLTVPSSIRRSTSAAAYLLQRPEDAYSIGTLANVRSCPSSVDLLGNNEQRRQWLLAINASSHSKDRTSLGCRRDYLPTPIVHRQWACSTNDIPSSATAMSEKGRLESRRFACDVNDNDVRVFKAMVYMEQARKQNTRPLTRLRQALGISSSSTTANFTSYNTKKQSNS